jgi:hypothetical protein
MIINKEGESPRPGALTKGTRHRSDKGPRATEGPVEVIGERPFRAKAKRRKARASGELAPSSEALFSSEMYVYWRRDGRNVDGFTWRDLLGSAEAVVLANERTSGR